MIVTKLLSIVFGTYCAAHDTYFKSDFCPGCIRARVVAQEVYDPRKEWVKSEGSWPVKR